MNILPKELYNKEVTSFINEMISFQDATTFSSLDELYQDQFSSLCIKAFGSDAVDIILSNEATQLLMRYLLSHDKDDSIEIMKELKKSAHENFSYYFDELISDERHLRRNELLEIAGKQKTIDKHGETRWL